jgi:hypothetical protein
VSRRRPYHLTAGAGDGAVDDFADTAGNREGACEAQGGIRYPILDARRRLEKSGHRCGKGADMTATKAAAAGGEGRGND